MVETIDTAARKEIEKAIIFLVFAIKKSGRNPKPVILHSVSVGLYLYNLAYPRHIVIAGILHDVVEDSDTKLEDVRKEFGKEVAHLVGACTYNTDIKNKTEQYKDAMQRCINTGKGALVVMAADIMENMPYYPLAESKEQYKLLQEKVRYFITISEKYLKDESLWGDLQEEYRKIEK